MAEHSDDSEEDGTAKCKAPSLVRDGYRCLLTGFFDETSTEEDSKLYDMCIQLRAGASAVVPSRIWNKSTVQGVGRGNGREMDKTHDATTAISILKSFGLNDFVQSLAEDGADRLGNLLSLDPISHIYFDKLNLWFEYTEKPNRYRVCVARPSHEVYLRKCGYLESDDRGRLFVTFSRTHDSQEFPDPHLVGLHAVCARVAHMSGATEAFEEEESEVEDTSISDVEDTSVLDVEDTSILAAEHTSVLDVEDTSILTVDRSSAHLLHHLSTPFVAIPWVA